MEGNFSKRIYDFLMKNETGLYKKPKTNEIIAYVHVDFWDLTDFVQIFGSYWFDEGGLEVQMFENTIAIEINEILEGLNQELSDYKGCFNEDDWEYYFS